MTVHHPPLPVGIPETFWSTGFLRSQGVTERELCLAVRTGRLLRPRRGRYLAVDTHPHVVEAVELGGRLDCVSLLDLLGVFVFTASSRHVAITPGSTRLPNPPPATVRHWRADDGGRERAVSALVAAVAQSVRCQAPRHAVATLDSVVHRGLLAEDDLAEVFALLPRRFAVLRPLVDGRSESGTESLVRLMLRSLGAHHDLQVAIEGVGRVDFVVDGWLIIECDSRAHHSAWSGHRRDRRRDLEAAALGYTTVRLLAEDILYRPAVVLATIRRVLASRAAHLAVGNSARIRTRRAKAV